MDDKPSLFSSHYLGRNGKAEDNIKAKDYFWNITRLGYYLVDFDRRLDYRVAKARCLFDHFRLGNNIAFTRSVDMAVKVVKSSLISEMLVWLQNAAAIVRIPRKILTMVIKRQLQEMMFLSKKKSPKIILFFNFFFLALHCYRSVEQIYKNSKHIFRLQWVLHKRETREYTKELWKVK